MEENSVRQIRWFNIFFFLLTTLVGTVGAAFYISRHGIAIPEIVLFAFYMYVTGMAITMGYHRLFAHATFKANSIVRFFILFFGAAAFEQSALKWAAQHRDHHRYVDTARDPYTIKKGFFYAHIGWLIFWKHKTHYENVRDLQKSKLIMSQHNYYILWAVGAGVVLPVLIGALTGHALGAFIFSVCTRITLVYHATFCINSVCHMFGKATYDIYSTAKDHWLAAMITGGEGYHNFHHRFPSDYRNGVRWYQWDPTKWTIAFLSKMNWAWDLKRISKFRILAARIAAENQRIQDQIATQAATPHLTALQIRVKNQYIRLRETLSHWEVVAREYQTVLREKIANHKEARRQAAFKKLEARKQFREALSSWKSVLSTLRFAAAR